MKLPPLRRGSIHSSSQPRTFKLVPQKNQPKLVKQSQRLKYMRKYTHQIVSNQLSHRTSVCLILCFLWLSGFLHPAQHLLLSEVDESYWKKGECHLFTSCIEKLLSSFIYKREKIKLLAGRMQMERVCQVGDDIRDQMHGKVVISDSVNTNPIHLIYSEPKLA